MDVPIFNDKYICIADRKHPILTAVISSYLQQENSFLSVFEFPFVSAEKPENYTEVIDEHSMTRKRSEDLNIQILNGINKIGGCEYLVLAGLDEKQKSYLTFLDKYNVLEIDSLDEVEGSLGGIAYD